jgi:hypothetical protein
MLRCRYEVLEFACLLKSGLKAIVNRMLSDPSIWGKDAGKSEGFTITTDRSPGLGFAHGSFPTTSANANPSRSTTSPDRTCRGSLKIGPSNTKV